MTLMANVQRFVKLVSSLPPSKEDMRKWYQVVNDFAPSGVISTLFVDVHGTKTETRLVKRTLKDRYELIVPLLRGLTPKEIESIANAWFATNQSGGFSVKANDSSEIRKTARNIGITKDDYETLAQQLAKAQHEAWVREKVADGWSYGIALNLTTKTHPMIRPWEDLPNEYRTIDGSNPNNFLSVLNNQGYAVVKQIEIDSLLRLIASIT